MKTTHNLDFEVKELKRLLSLSGWIGFRVGTIEGAWRATRKSYQILSIINSDPGNGHLTDVLEWFESSCKRDKKSLVILELWNEGFKKHLINKRGFKKSGKDNLEKKFI